MDRKRFIQSLIGASAFLAMPYSSYGKEDESIIQMVKDSSASTNSNLFGFKVGPIQKVRVGIIGLGNRGTTLLEMFRWLVENNHAEIVALSDLQERKVSQAKDRLNKWQTTAPKTYSGKKNEWKKTNTLDIMRELRVPDNKE